MERVGTEEELIADGSAQPEEIPGLFPHPPVTIYVETRIPAKKCFSPFL